MDQLASAFAIPPHTLGVTPEPKGRVERGEKELAELRHFERGYRGVELQRSADAQFVVSRETLWLMGLA